MAAIAPDVKCIRKHGVVAIVLWIYSSKRGEFISFYCYGQGYRVSTVSKIRASVRIKVRFSFSNKVGIGFHFSTWSECNFTSVTRRVGTA